MTDPTIADYYARVPEEDRLTQGHGLLEAARTRQLIEQLAPPPPRVVLDLGGAAGAYAFWLAGRGYAVHLIDASPRLIAEARRRAPGQPSLESCHVGDARALAFPDHMADIVLLLGPLYHLIHAADRAQALTEARRVLAPGGWLFAAVISRWASALDGLARDLLLDSRFAAIMRRDLEDGQHRNPTERIDYFTTAYFHHPGEITTEIEAAGFTTPTIYGIEGPGWLLPDVADRMKDPARRNELLQIAGLLETEPHLLGANAHLLAAAQAPSREGEHPVAR
jgi:SAM-dependent methyltransferase